MSVTDAAGGTEYAITTWDLSELLPSEEESVLSERLKTIESAVEALEARRGELSADLTPETFADLLDAHERLLSRMQVLAAYASLRFAADTVSAATLSLKNRIQHVLTGLHNRVLFFTLWWRALEEPQALRLLPQGDEGADRRHFLEDLRRFAPYTLVEQSEQIINTKDANGIEGVLTLYTMLTNRLEFILEMDGRTETLTRDGLMKYVRSPDADLRRRAYTELHRVYGKEAPILGQVYANRVRDWHSENVELRGFESPIAVRNLANDVPGEAVRALLDVCSRNTGVFQRYFRLKAGMLGLPRLRRYDIYAPVGTSDREVPYPEAVEKVLATFDQFEPTISQLARKVFDEAHIDSEVRKGKQGGAFCMTVLPEHTPWLLMNYTGEVRDVATLAHELGHAVHSMLASGHSILTQHPSLPLAETASVFGEMLVTDRLLSEEKEPTVRRELLASALDDMYATVMRQAFFVKFEIEAHRAVLNNASQEALNHLYMGTLREQFGDSVEVSDDFAYEWLSIPHIYNTPFYCYAYSFGQLLVLALYRRFQIEGDAFKPGYIRLLSYGGSARPHEILREAGIEMADPAFWQGGFDVISGLIDEMEAVHP